MTAVKFYALAVYLMLVIVLTGSVIYFCDGHFIYPMDDPYIGLAQAEHIARGNYGINDGETSSPCSSVIWPFLMTIGAGTSWHPLLPLLFNIICGAVTVWYIAEIIESFPWEEDIYARRFRQLGAIIALTVVGNIVGLVFLGMEHSLQLLLTVICAKGMLKAWSGEPVPLICLIAAILAPAVRYELFTLVLALAIALCGQARFLAGLGITGTSMIMPGLLSLFLVSHHLPLLPNSVLAKTRAFAGSQFSVSNWLHNNLGNLDLYEYNTAWQAELALIFIFSCLMLAGSNRPFVLLGSFISLCLHFLFGKFGWFHRYEVYSILFASVVLFGVCELYTKRTFLFAAGFLFLISESYILGLGNIPLAAQNIYNQQFQMHRFVSEYYKKDVAINDLGWVSYQRPPGIYILDLYGLASSEALQVPDRNAVWLDAITHKHHVGLAIIYPSWYTSIPKDWTRVAELYFDTTNVSCGYANVYFYRTPDGNLDEIQAELAAFEQTLPVHAHLVHFQ